MTPAISEPSDRERPQEDPGGGRLNLAHEAVGRHARGARRHHPALVWESAKGAVERFTGEILGSSGVSG